MALLTFGITIYDRWKLGIGEPTIAEWLTTAAFITTAILCWGYARCPESFRKHRLFWGSLAVALLILGINKQLDLHTLLETVGREVAKTYGWYSQRRTIQIFFNWPCNSKSRPGDSYRLDDASYMATAMAGLVRHHVTRGFYYYPSRINPSCF